MQEFKTQTPVLEAQAFNQCTLVCQIQFTIKRCAAFANIVGSITPPMHTLHGDADMADRLLYASGT